MDAGRVGGESKATLPCDMLYTLHGVLLQAGASSQTAAVTSVVSFKLLLKFANAWVIMADLLYWLALDCTGVLNKVATECLFLACWIIFNGWCFVICLVLTVSFLVLHWIHEVFQTTARNYRS